MFFLRFIVLFFIWQSLNGFRSDSEIPSILKRRVSVDDLGLEVNILAVLGAHYVVTNCYVVLENANY